MLGDIETIIPPLDEQRLISRYLDKKTQQIDTLIEKIEKKIELLKEQRTSRINHYVTKGLDPNVEMKDSGVEWIGKIPKHWEVTKLKYLVSYNDSVLTEDTNPNYQFHYIEISDVDYIDGIKLTDKTIFSESPSRARRIVQPNDVIISTVRTYLRAIGVVPNKSDIICSTGFCVLRDNSGKLDQQFLSYIVKANWFISRVISESFGVSYPAINASALVELEVLLPPLDEQREICSFIQSRLKVSEAQIAHEKRRVSLVSEYRQSLISSVVTGKVRVTEDMV
jgi:type I restriction enzyme S subunit